MGDDRPQRQVGLDGAVGSLAHLGDERLGLLTRRREVLVDGDALVCKAVFEVAQPAADRGIDERLGDLDRHEVGDRGEDLVAHEHLRLDLGGELEPGPQISAQRVDRVELTHLGDPLVSGVGKHLALRRLHEHLEGDLLPGLFSEPLGQRVVELQDVAEALAA